MSTPVQSGQGRSAPPGPGAHAPPGPGGSADPETAPADERPECTQRYWDLLPGLLPVAPFLPRADLIVVDVETTGWLADSAAITEIGAIRLSPGAPAREFSALVNPQAPIPPAITSLTGITDAMVGQAPPIGAVLPQFLAFAAGAVLVAHNAPFDVAFLTEACHRCGIEWPGGPVIDTAVLSRMLLGPPEVHDHKLATLASHFSASTGPCHRALADASATTAVLAGLLRSLAAGPRPPAGPARYAPAAPASAANPPTENAGAGTTGVFVQRLPGGAERRRAEPLRCRRGHSAGSEHTGGGHGHRDSPDQGRCRAHSRDSGGDSPDLPGQ